MFRPTPSKIKFGIPTLDGGLNTKYTDQNTPANQTPDCQDVVFDDFGAVGAAYGYSKLNSTAIGSFPIDGAHEYVDNTGTRRFLAACGGSINEWDGNNFNTIASGVSICTAGQDVYMRTINNYAYLSNGYMPVYKYDGTNFTRVNPSNVTAGGASVVSSGAGNLNGTYNWAITGVNSANVQGDYSVLLAAGVSFSSRQATISGIPVFPTSFGVVDKYIYRNTAGVSDVYYRVTSIANATTSYVDNALDSALVTSAPDDNGAPPYVAFIVEHRNRAFGAGDPSYPMRLYWSNSGSPEVWESTSYVDIGGGDGQEIRGLVIYGNALFIHKNDGKGHGSIWSVYMPDSIDVTSSENWYIDKVAVSDGSTSHKVLTSYNNIMWYINSFGAYAFTGTDIAKSPAYSAVGVFPVDSLSFLIDPNVKQWKDSLLDKAAATNYDNKIWLAVPNSSNSNTNDRIYVFDYLRASSPDQITGAWSILNNPPVNCFAQYDGDLYGGSAIADGFVYKLNSGTSQSGAAIDSYFKTIWIPGHAEHKENTKVWRHLWLWVETSGSWNLNITYWVDFDSGAGTSTTLDLSSGGSTWGDAVWSVDTWGGGENRKLLRVDLINAVGTVIQFKFGTNTADQFWKIYSMQLDYNLRRVR
jgi:hypothetical protein